MTTPIESLLSEYEALASGATPPGWCEVSVPLNYDGFIGRDGIGGGWFITVRHGHGNALEAQSRRDAAFIVWCRNNVPTLVAHLKDALAEVERLRNG